LRYKGAWIPVILPSHPLHEQKPSPALTARGYCFTEKVEAFMTNRFKPQGDKLIDKVCATANYLQSVWLEYKIGSYRRSLPKDIPIGRADYIDYRDYLLICKLAVEKDDIFKDFKRTKDYKVILEHVSRELGQSYLNIIKKEKSLLKYLPAFKENNKVGCPITYKYDVGMFSPTTLRYSKVLLDLKTIEVFDEEPQTGRDNFIIKWDDEKNNARLT